MRSDDLASEGVLWLSLEACEVAVAAAHRSGLPVDQWLSCAISDVADKEQGFGEGAIGTCHTPIDSLNDRLARQSSDGVPSEESSTQQRAGRAREELPVLDQDPSRALLEQAGKALEAARSRISELHDALQGLVDLSDSSRDTDLAQVKRSLVRAKEVLSTASQTGMFCGEDGSNKAAAAVSLAA